MTARNLQVSCTAVCRNVVAESALSDLIMIFLSSSFAQQDKVKKKGLPWSAAKGFDTFNPIR